MEQEILPGISRLDAVKIKTKADKSMDENKWAEDERSKIPSAFPELIESEIILENIPEIIPQMFAEARALHAYTLKLDARHKSIYRHHDKFMSSRYVRMSRHFQKRGTFRKLAPRLSIHCCERIMMSDRLNGLNLYYRDIDKLDIGYLGCIESLWFPSEHSKEIVIREIGINTIQIA